MDTDGSDSADDDHDDTVAIRKRLGENQQSIGDESFQKIMRRTFRRRASAGGSEPTRPYAIENFADDEACYAAMYLSNGTKWFVPYDDTMWIIPYDLVTEEICLAAIRTRGADAMDDIQNPSCCGVSLTPEFYRKCVEASGDTLQYVPMKFRTREMCLAAVRSDSAAQYALAYVPHKLRTPDLYLEAVRHDEDALDNVPAKFKTRELCLEAIKHSGTAMRYVPTAMKTLAFCRDAVRLGSVFSFDRYHIPAELRTAELYLEAVHADGHFLVAIPKEHRSFELCFAAVTNDDGGDAYWHVPEDMRSHMSACARCCMACKWTKTTMQKAIYYALRETMQYQIVRTIVPSLCPS